MMARVNDWIEAQHTRPPAPTRWWYVTLAAGLLTALFSLHLAHVFPGEGAAVPPGYGAPVIAFEFARNEAELVAIFGAESDPAQIGRLAAMRAGNEQDYLFLLLYAAFLTSGLAALWRELRQRWLLAATVLPVVAALCDATENYLLFDIQAAFTLGDYSPAMATLPWPVAMKFLALALTNAAIGGAVAQMPRGGRLAAVLIVVPCFAVPMALVAPAAFGWTLTAAIGAGWIALLILSLIGSGQALLRGRPLVDFEAEMPRRRASDRGEADVSLAPGRLRQFGRRRDDHNV